MNAITYLFSSNNQKYAGIRPFNIYAMKAIYLLMATFLAYDCWTYILTHDGTWDPSEAMNWSVWTAFSLMAVLGFLKPVQMIPILILEILYKTLWLSMVAVPLMQSGTLSNDATDGMLLPFALVLLPIIAIPWGYVVKTYIFKSQ